MLSNLNSINEGFFQKISNFYRPQRSSGEGYVILFTGGGSASVHAGKHTHPQEACTPPEACTPKEACTPLPPGNTHPSPGKQTLAYGNEQAVRILLECILGTFSFVEPPLCGKQCMKNLDRIIDRF